MAISITHNQDCLEAMRQMPDKVFDLCLTDPPYNVNLAYVSHNDKMADYREWCLAWLTEALRVAKVVAFTPGTVNYIDQIIAKRPYGMIPWVKLNQMSGSTFRGFNVWEPVLIYGKPKYVIPHDVVTERVFFQVEADFHPCPKSLNAWQRILGLLARPCDSVLDIFLGSGTGRIAAYNLQINFTGYELDKYYFDAQEKRFADHIAQPKLFAPMPIVETQEVLFG